MGEWAAVGYEEVGAPGQARVGEAEDYHPRNGAGATPDESARVIATSHAVTQMAKLAARRGRRAGAGACARSQWSLCTARER